MSDHEKAYRRLLKDHILGRSSGSRLPKAFLIAGPPGSGKSRLAAAALEACRSTGGHPVHVDSDRLRRYVPGYEALAVTEPAQAFTLSQQWVSQWSDSLRDHAIDARLDIICEGLFKTDYNNRVLLDALLAQSYDVEVVAKIITPALSLLQTELRYERQLAGRHGREATPRRVPAAAHDAAYGALPRLVELAVASSVRISLRDIGNMPLEKMDGLSPNERLKQLRTTAPPEEEQLAATKLLVSVQEFRAMRGAPELPEPGSALEAALSLIARWP